MQSKSKNMPADVQDKKAEFGINLSVIIQGLLLASTIGFGTRLVNSVDTLINEVGKLSTVTSVNSSEIKHNTAGIANNSFTLKVLSERVDNHIHKGEKHE